MITGDGVVEILRSGKQLVANVTSFLGEEKLVKCIIDGSDKRNFELTSNALNYLRSIHSKQWIYDVIYDDCVSFNAIHGFGSEWYLFFVGVWLDVFEDLVVGEGVPVNVVACTLSMLVQISCRDVIKSHGVNITNLHLVAGLNAISALHNPKQILQQAVADFESLHLNKTKNLSPCINRKSNPSLPDLQKIPGKVPPKTSNIHPYNNSPRRTTRTFSRYSRHATNISDDASMLTSTNPSDLVRHLCRSVCGEENEDVLEILCGMYLHHMHRISATEDTYLSELSIQSHRLMVTAYSTGLSDAVTSKCVVSKGAYTLHDGIVLQCFNTYIFDMLQKMDNTTINVLLVNTEAHGVTLPKSEDLHITQVVHGIPQTSRDADDKQQQRIMESLENSNVSLILYRGCMKNLNVSEFTRKGVAVVAVKDFTLLHKLSILLSCPIVFGLSLVEEQHVGKANYRVVGSYDAKTGRSQKTKIVVTKENGSFLRFLLAKENKEDDAAKPTTFIYTVLVYGKTDQLCHLLDEKFREGFGRMESALRNQRHIRCHVAHEKLRENLRSLANNKSKAKTDGESVCGGFPPWVHEECWDYIGVVCGAVDRVLARRMGQCGADVRYQSSGFTAGVWRDSLACVMGLLSSRKMSIQL